jgi:nitroreductase
LDAIEAIKTRRSVRRFEDREVPKEIIEDLIDCGRLAPSGRGVHPWEFIVVTNKETRRRIADLTYASPYSVRTRSITSKTDRPPPRTS